MRSSTTCTARGRLVTYPLFALSVLLGVVVCFGCRYPVNAAGFWLLDVRGVNLAWTFATSVLSGLAFPVHFLPPGVVAAVSVGTPFPSIQQAPLDVLVERGFRAHLAGLVARQAAWSMLMVLICWYLQRRAEHRLVIQGG